MSNSLVDWELLKQTVGDDHEFMLKSIELFKKNVPKYLDEIKAANASQDSAALMNGAHSMKGMVVYFNNTEIYDLCFALEQAGRNGDLPQKTPETRHTAEMLETKLDAMIAELDAFVKQDA